MKKLLLFLIVTLITLLCALSTDDVRGWMINTTIIVGVLCIIVGAMVQVIEQVKKKEG